MIDIHSHILPGIDDGPKDMATSLDMAKLYVDNGIEKVVATPHYIEGTRHTVHPDIIRSAVESINIELEKYNIPLLVYPGNEIYVRENTLKTIVNDEVLSLNDSDFVLIEFPMNDKFPSFAEEIIYDLRLKGLKPIISHPERCLEIIEDPNKLHSFIEIGALAQLNLPSLSGEYGQDIKRTAIKLIQHNMIHFLGTDAHSNKDRTPDISKALEVLRDYVSQVELEKLRKINPKLLLENKEIVVNKPIKVKEVSK